MSNVQEKIPSSLDRWHECHWHIHQIEQNYHSPDLFRYSFNSFIRAIKEIPQILSMELQNDVNYKSTYKPIIRSLREDPLFSMLSSKRDFIVHRGMLDLLSKGQIGTTEGRHWKIIAKFRVEPYESSDEAYKRFKEICKSLPEIRCVLGPDCDSWPVLRREWKIKEFPDTDLLDLAVEAWQKVGLIISQILRKLGDEELDTTMSCRHEPESVRCREYSQHDFFKDVDIKV